MNKRNRNTLIGTVIAVSLIIGGIVGISGASEDGEDISLGDVRAWAAADNIATERLFNDLADARSDLAQAEDDKGSGSGVAWHKSLAYDVNVAALAEDKVLWDISSGAKNLDLQAVDLYFELQLTEDEMGIASLEVNALAMAYEEMVEKFDLGLETQLNVDSAKVDVMAAESAMALLEYDYEGLLLDMNQLLNRDLSQDYLFEKAVTPTPASVTQATSDRIDEAVSVNRALTFMYEELELLEALKAIYVDLNDNDQYNGDIAALNIDIEEKEMAIYDEERGIEIEILTSYNDLLSAADDIRLAELTLESLEIDLALAQEELSMEKVTKAYVSSVERTLSSQEIALERAQVAYYIACESYNMLFEGY